MAEITIAKVQVSEVDSLRQVAVQTFEETFAFDNNPEQLQAFYDEAYSIEKLTSEVEDKESDTYFIRVDGEIAGFLKVNWGQAQTEHELDNAFEIQRIYVLKAFQGQGLGKHLFEYALKLAESSTFDWAWLGVWEHNTKAQGLYAKYGFEKFAEHSFPVGDKVDTDWLLKKRLNK